MSGKEIQKRTVVSVNSISKATSRETKLSNAHNGQRPVQGMGFSDMLILPS